MDNASHDFPYRSSLRGKNRSFSTTSAATDRHGVRRRLWAGERLCSIPATGAAGADRGQGRRTAWYCGHKAAGDPSHGRAEWGSGKEVAHIEWRWAGAARSNGKFQGSALSQKTHNLTSEPSHGCQVPLAAR
jgi:hypothetical protein